jgi:hypothetical protein
MNIHLLTLSRSFLLLTILFFCSLSILFCQPKKGKFGITTAISKGFVQSQNISVNAGSLNIGMVYLPTDRISLRCEIGFLSHKDTSEAKNSEFTFTSNLWYYLQTTENVSTFLGGSMGFGSASTASGNGMSLFSLSGYFGAEYWFSSRFSWFGHIGLVYNSYSVAEKPASDIFTSATTGLIWYF